MRNTSKKTAKKRTPKHPQITRPTRIGIVYANRFAYAYGEADVQPSSLPGNSSTERPKCQGLFLAIFRIFRPRIGDSSQCTVVVPLRGKLEFVGLFGQWCAVSMRYTALPPALVRGVVRVAHTGTGGSPSPTYLSQKRTRNKDGKYRKIILFNALQPGIRTPPATSVRTGGTPLVNAGGKASIHSRTVTARQIPNLSGNRGLCL